MCVAEGNSPNSLGKMGGKSVGRASCVPGFGCFCIFSTKLFTFEAAHQLPKHSGKCARLHGHSYRLEVTVVGDIIKEEGSSEGMVVDFADLSKIVEKEIIEQWDHQFLNDLLAFRTTAELLAVEAFRRLKDAGLSVSKITLWETAKAFVVVEE